MKARDWLAAQGLAIAGARGKFSTPAIAALNKALADGEGFDDWDEQGRKQPQPRERVIYLNKPKPEPRVIRKPKEFSTVNAPIVKSLPFVRVENTLSIVDNGVTINVDHCKNGHSIRRCECRKIEAPAGLTGTIKLMVI